MSGRALVVANPVAAKAPVQRHAPTSLLQRKCDCGGSAAMEGECEDCKKKKLQRRATGTGPAVAPAIVHDVLRSAGQPLDMQARSFFEPRFGHDFSRVRVHTDSRAAQSAKSVHALAYTTGENLVFAAGQYSPDTQAGRRLLAHELTHVVQQDHAGTKAVQRKLEVGLAHDPLEQEAERFAEQVTSDRGISAASPPPPPSRGSGRKVQRASAAGEGNAQAAAAAAPAPGDLVVEDEADAIGPGQMRKTEFLDKLRDSTCAAADSVLASMGRTAQGCPFIERWIARLRTRTSKHIERAIRKYAPESANAAAAQGYLAAVSERVSRGVARWASTGEISGVRPELIGEMAGGGILGGIASAVSSIAGAIGGAASGIGKLFAKARDGGARDADPVSLRGRLGAGRTLDPGVRGRMESVFGHSFSGVRVHADSGAAQLSSAMNSRAFTIGSDIAFAAGEYQPDTLIGDALIAHELAHVMQQGGGSARPVSQNSAEYNSLEQDADLSAVGAMFSLWGGAKSMGRGARANVLPQLRSGLRLQRCGASKAPVQQAAQAAPAPVPLHPACPPALQNPAWDVSPTMALLPMGGGCNLQLGAQKIPVQGSPAGIQGMGFQANLDIAANCQGGVHFVQYVKIRKLALIACNGNKAEGVCAQTDWRIDTNDVYPFGSRLANISNPQPSAAPITTYDSPGRKNISNPDMPQVRICLDHEFVTYIVYEDALGSPTPLGWMHWMFFANAWRDQGACPPASSSNDCKGWQVSGGGTKMNSDFHAGSMGPQPLDLSVPVLKAEELPLIGTECPESSCSVPGTPAPDQQQSVPVQHKLEIGPVNDPREREADRVAQAVAGSGSVLAAGPASLNSGDPKVQRAAAAPVSAASAPQPPASAQAELIVEDDAAALQPGQMHKTEFLDGLHNSVCATADSVLAAAGRSAQGCPFIERWIARLRTRTSKHIERAIRKYAPESANALTATDYFGAVGERVRHGVSRWAATGDISGVPPELMSEVAGGGVLGAIGGAVAGVFGAIGGAVSGIGRLFAKTKDGGVPQADPSAVQASLGRGAPLEGGVRTRMETAFGHSFSGVRIHSGSRAAQVSAGLNSRAFTVGRDVAFAAGEYRPGTPVGDALIAHELAHFLQQGSRASSTAPAAVGAADYDNLEEDADLSAVGAMMSLWGRARAGTPAGRADVVPRLRAGLRLQRCGGEPTPAARSIKPEATNIRWDPNANCGGLEPQIGSFLGEAVARVRIARDALDTPANVAGPLMKNFKMSADDPSVAKVVQVLQGVIEAMEAAAQGKSQTASMGTTPAVVCTPCAGDNASTTDVCDKSSGPVVVGLCVSGAQLVSPNPVRTIVHEFIHASCGRTKEVVASPAFLATGSTGVTITAGGEKERKLQTVQPEVGENLKSAYAYAQFVMDVSGS